MASVEELGKDLQELEKFNKEATRQRVKNILSVEISKLETEIKKQMTSISEESSKSTASADIPTKVSILKEKITKYGFDQSEKFMKLYITLNGVQNINKENISANFTDRSVHLEVVGLNEKNYEFHINNLCEEINVEGSYYKVKNDMILVMLKKKNPGLNWTHVTAGEKKKSEKDTADLGMKDGEDPNASMMKLLKKMYDEGDDEMKRTIAKSMSESQNKAGVM